MDRNELIDWLTRLDFQIGETASRKWKAGLARSNGVHTLIVLPRAGGVDLVLTRLRLSEMLNGDGRLSVSMQRQGDRCAEYNYHGSEANVHQRIRDVVRLFIDSQPIPDSYLYKLGVRRSERERTGETEMLDLYTQLSNRDGMPVYLEGGVSLRRDGTLV